MHVYGPVHLHGPQAIGAPHTARPAKPAEPTGATPVQDELQLSSEAQLVDRIRDLPEIREDRVARIRAEIAAGTYETDEKLQIALGRLLDEIG
ncbi:MAG: flagellar biosynthesis anti-sigma factor FlgM [Thermoguttaceae bacterium]|jgi:negative regulator of flagellin synthesis FlgM|nr:flagellar biosynthesis anti-sigma factor FlgM [Thermoguttaceae bacterium]